jgi:hypothetical protein
MKDWQIRELRTWNDVLLCIALMIVFLCQPPSTAAADDSTNLGKSSSTFNRRASTSGSSYPGSTDSGFGSSRTRDSIFGSRSSDRTAKKNATDKTSADRTKTRERASNQPGAKGAKAEPKKTEKTVKGKKAPQKKASSGGQSRSATTVEFKMKASPSTNILTIETTDLASTMHTVAQVGQPIVTRIVFRNGQQANFNSIELSLRYDPKVLQLEGVDDNGISALLKEPAVAKADTNRGIFYYHANFAEPRKDDFFVVCKLQWKALAPTEHTSLDFVNTADLPTRVLDGEKNLLLPQSGADDAQESDELEPSPRRGLLGADIAVAPTPELLQKMQDEEAPLTGAVLARQISDGIAVGGITLALRPRRSSVKVGDEFLVDVVYENPNRVEVDSMKVTITFDPAALEVVDYDDDGWITKGINAYDAPYHEDLPFDFHIRNVAYNQLGKLQYQMGFASRTRIPASGTLFTVKFRALAPSPATDIGFEFDEAQKSAPTSISFLGFNLIGSPKDRTTSLHKATIHIEP